MKNILISAVIATLLVISESGSPCPARESIYPCFCTTIPLSKKQVFTDITCRHLQHTDSLSGIFHELQRIHIDRFIIYDSFWGIDDHQKKKLPNNWFSLLKIKDLQIVDSNISNDIGCYDTIVGCPNNIPTFLSITNSSSADEFVTFCEGTLKYSWINCMRKLQNFRYINNKLKKISSKFFFMPMDQLLVANFSHNAIQEIEKEAFKNLPKLTTLDLSHNMIRDIGQMFGEKSTVLSYLDLSENFIIQVPSDILKLTSLLTYLGLKSNRINKLPEADWKHLSKEIRTLALDGNLIECDCHIIWINCTLKVHSAVTGFCINEEYQTTPLRRVSKYMSERCVDGEITIRVNRTKLNACTDWDNRRNPEEYPIRLEGSDNNNHENTMNVFPAANNRMGSRRRTRSASPRQLRKHDRIWTAPSPFLP